MAFNFQAYRNPYVSTIAELLSRGEDAKAKALVDVANAQARAAEARGQAYGGAIESVGKIVSGIPAQIQAGKDQAFKNEQQAQARLEFADKATARAEQAKGKEAVGFLASLDQGPDPNYQRDPATGTSRYEGPPSPDYSSLFDQGDFGQKTFNPAKTRQALNAAGYGEYADQLMVNVGKQNQDVADFVQKRNDIVAQAASHALAMFRAPKVDGSQTAWADAVNGVGSSLVANGIYKQSDLDALIASGQDQGRQGQEQLLIGLMRKGSEKAVILAPGTTTMLGGQVIGKVAEKPIPITPVGAVFDMNDESGQSFQYGRMSDGSVQRLGPSVVPKTPPGPRPNYTLLVSPTTGEQRQVTDGDEANKLLSQGWTTASSKSASNKEESGPTLLRAALSSLKEIDGGLTQRSGVTGMLAGAGQGIMGAANLDVVPGVYNGLAAAIPIRLAKASGEQGNLALGEQAVWRPIVPKASDPYNIRQAKYAAIEAFTTAVESGKQTRDASGIIVSNSRLADNLLATLTRLNGGAVTPNAAITAPPPVVDFSGSGRPTVVIKPKQGSGFVVKASRPSENQ